MRVAVDVLVAALASALVAWAWYANATWFELHMLPNYCAQGGVDRARGVLWRAGALALAAVLAVVVRPRVARWLARRSTRDAAASVGGVLAATLLALGVCELVLRRVMPLHVAPPVKFALPPARHDDRLTWTPEPRTTTRLLEDGREVVYAFDANGYRARTQDDAIDPDRPTIVFAGESVTMGLGVQYDETFAALVGDRLGVQVVNAAVHGYGHDQAYLRALDALALLRHPVAVVTTALTGALNRDVFDTRPTLRLGGDGSLVLVPAPEGWWATSRLRELARRLVPYHDDEALRIARAIFAATARAARSRGARPLFLTTNYLAPCLAGPGGAVPAERAMFDGLGLDVVRVDLDPTWIVRTNEHPDARAHRKLADALVAALRRQGTWTIAGQSW